MPNQGQNWTSKTQQRGSLPKLFSHFFGFFSVEKNSKAEFSKSEGIVFLKLTHNVDGPASWRPVKFRKNLTSSFSEMNF